MRKSICAVDLNLPEVPFNIMPEISTTDTIWNVRLIPKDHLNVNFVKFLKTKGIKVVENIMLFAIPPGGKSILHVDSIDNKHNLSYINYVYGSNDHEMVWYHIDEMLPQKYPSDPYISFDDEVGHSAEKIYRHKVKFPSLVKVGIPHQIFNYDTKTRFCLSVSVANKYNKIRNNWFWDRLCGIDFDWGVDALQDYIVK